MSIVSVHGPNMWGGAGAAGGGSGNVIQNAQIKVTADQANGLKFTVEPVNTQRIAADYDWTLSGGTPATQADTKTPFTVTYATAGSKTIQLVIAAGAGPPAGGTYTIDVTAKTGPRSVEAETMPTDRAVIESIDPEWADLSDPDFDLHVYGQNFDDDATIVFNGGEESTTRVSDTELTTGVKPSLVGTAITVPILVRQQGGDSNEVEFSFLDEATAPEPEPEP